MEKYHKVTRWPPTLQMDAADQEENRLAVGRRLRVFSAYRLQTGHKVWIITEADRRMTTLLRPEEY